MTYAGARTSGSANVYGFLKKADMHSKYGIILQM